MSSEDSEETPIAFHDVAAYFSEEDWKLLHQWQKELYTSVMEEIHQAVISLGYQITNPEVLLRVNNGGEAYIPDLENPKGTEYISDPSTSVFCYPTVNPDILFRIKQEEEQCLRHGCDSVETEIGNSHSQGIIATSFYSLSTEEENEMCPKDLNDSQNIYSNNGLSAGPVVTTVCSLSLNNEEERPFEEQQEPEGRAVGNGTMDVEIMAEPVHCTEKSPPCIMSSGNIEVEVPQCAENGTNWRNQLCSESNQELEGETCTQWEGAFTNSADSILYWGSPNHEGLDISNEYVSDLEETKLLACQQNPEQRFRPYQCNTCGICFSRKVHLITHQITHTGETGDTPYQCTECETSFSQKIYLIAHQRTHLGIKSYHCTECKTSFSQKIQLIAHQRTHMGLNPYQCANCEKSFKKKSSCISHQRIHTGERPYTCSECEKGFCTKSHLSSHEKMHAGVRPFQCPECKRSYIEKKSLNRHYRTHSRSVKTEAVTSQRLYQSTECGKSYDTKRELSRHKNTHTEGRPYQCNECSHSFKLKAYLHKHKRTHTEGRPHQCAECSHRFKQKADLHRHKRTHTGERPYQCSDCERRYSQKCDLKRHQLKHNCAYKEERPSTPTHVAYINVTI